MPKSTARPAAASLPAAALADRLHSASIRLLRQLRAEDAHTGLSGPRLSALSVVATGPLSIGALAAAEQVKAPTMTRLVDAMEREGLLAREPDPNDARRVVIRATDRGLRILQAGRRRRVDTLAA